MICNPNSDTQDLGYFMKYSYEYKRIALNCIDKASGRRRQME